MSRRTRLFKPWPDEKGKNEFEEPLKAPPHGLQWHQLDDQEWELRAINNATPVQQEIEGEGGKKQEKEKTEGDDEDQEEDETTDARKGEGHRLCAFASRHPLADRPMTALLPQYYCRSSYLHATELDDWLCRQICHMQASTGVLRGGNTVNQCMHTTCATCVGPA